MALIMAELFFAEVRMGEGSGYPQPSEALREVDGKRNTGHEWKVRSRLHVGRFSDHNQIDTLFDKEELAL